MLTLFLDGLLLQIIKSKEFGHHDPGMFARHANGAIIIIIYASVVGFVILRSLHPMVWATIPVAVS